MSAEVRDLKQRMAEETRLIGGMCLQIVEDGLGVRLPLTSYFLHEHSYFFRDMRAFEEALVRHHDRVRRPIHVLCVGCGRGQEPYSVAMIAAARHIPVAVTAVDRSPRAIALARAAVYDLGREHGAALAAGDREAASELAAHLDRFELLPAGHRVAEGIRSHVRFEVMDAAELPFDCELDFVLCRNTLYYLPAPKRRRAILGLQRALYAGLPFDHIVTDAVTRSKRYF